MWPSNSAGRLLIVAALLTGASFCFANINDSAVASSPEPGSTDVRSMLFRNTDVAMAAAKKAKAEILAPKTFGEAMQDYRNAAADYEKGKNLEDIRRNLRIATSRFVKAREATKLAVVVFGAALQARTDAISAEAAMFADEKFAGAEKKLFEAASTLEDGDAKSARKKSGEAETLFRAAELQAIKVNYLNEAYALLNEAERTKVRDHAPKTLEQAQYLVNRAEKELSENRYDTDVARVLARQAKREAKHAIFLAKTIKSMKDNKQNWEDVMLDSEKPLRKIAAATDIMPAFDSGYEATTQEVIKNFIDCQKNVSTFKAEAFDNATQLSLSQQYNDELRKKLGGVEQEKSALAKRLETQEKIREMYAAVEKLFTREEAIFIREGNDVILRLVGLSFPVGKATIDPTYYDFLSKVQQAIATFPNVAVVIEGHTDSYGSDETNLRLSIERAEGVKQYLASRMTLDTAKIEAIGFGESRPIVSNETEEGRARNRRIEVIIQPKLEDM